MTDDTTAAPQWMQDRHESATSTARKGYVVSAKMSRPVHWKEVACPTCDALPGFSCGRPKLGVPWVWETVSPHAARKRAALQPIKPQPCPGEPAGG